MKSSFETLRSLALKDQKSKTEAESSSAATKKTGGKGGGGKKKKTVSKGLDAS